MKIRPFSIAVPASLFAGLVISQAASAQMVVPVAEPLPTLFVVESCKPLAKGGRCTLSLEQIPAGAAAPAQMQTRCAPGWVAHFRAEQGTVESGGINRGASVVCGYTSPEAALRAAIQACSQQTFVECNVANEINVTWANWGPSSLTATTVAQPVSVAQIPGALSCVSGIPVKESAQCSAQAAAQLRAAGLR